MGRDHRSPPATGARGDLARAPAALRSVVVAISVLVLPPSHHPRRSKADPERDLTTSYGSDWSTALPDVRRRERAFGGSRRGSSLRTYSSKQ